ncbi:MAG TPA: glycosyl hydrolase family 28-related protein [Nitrososphaeraceae archaeon]|nr:glycosyl hydrolase family 28-related protein [Nitrososphaeraceae archaeon]
MKYLLLLACCLSSLQAAQIKQLNVLKESFRTGDKPTEGEFEDLMASTFSTVNSLAQLYSVDVTTVPLNSNLRVYVLGRNAPGDGFEGQFIYYPTSQVATNDWNVFERGTGRWIRALEDITNVKRRGVKGDGVTDDAPAINKAIASGGDFYFPAGNYRLGAEEVLIPSNTKIMGRGARWFNGATNIEGKIMVRMKGANNVVFDGITLDGIVGSHWKQGNLWIMGCTNVYVGNFESRNGNYLANYVVVGWEDPGVFKNQSEYVVGHNFVIGDQPCGGSGISTANISIAEGSRYCGITGLLCDYSVTGNLGIEYEPTPGPEHPQRPVLAISIDRGFYCYLKDATFLNTSRQAGLAAVTFEDNSGATNIFNYINNIVVRNYAVGVQLKLYGGRFTAENLLVQDCDREGFQAYQTEFADKHDIAEIAISNSKFINNYMNSSFGIDANDHAFSKAGQVSWGGSLPYVMKLQNVDFIYNSTDTNLVHILHNSGELDVQNCSFNGGFFGIRVPDPVIPNEQTPNGFYEAYGRYRKLRTFNCRYLGVSFPVYGEADPFGDLSLVDFAPQNTIRSTFYKVIPANTWTQISEIRTIESDRSEVGKSGGYNGLIKFHVTNQEADSTHNNTNLFKLGQGFLQGFALGWSHFVTEGGSESFPTNTLMTPFGVTPPAITHSRGYTNISVFATNTVWHTTQIFARADAINVDTPVAVFKGEIELNPTGWYQLPRILQVP